MSDIVVIFEPIPTIEVTVEKAPDVVVEFPSSQGVSGVPWEQWPPWDGDSVTWEVLTGTINGINVNFALAHTPTFWAKIFLNGMRLKEWEDYNRSSNTLTFQNPPVAGDILLADYNF